MSCLPFPDGQGFLEHLGLLKKELLLETKGNRQFPVGEPRLQLHSQLFSLRPDGRDLESNPRPVRNL